MLSGETWLYLCMWASSLPALSPTISWCFLYTVWLNFFFFFRYSIMLSLLPNQFWLRLLWLRVSSWCVSSYHHIVLPYIPQQLCPWGRQWAVTIEIHQSVQCLMCMYCTFPVYILEYVSRNFKLYISEFLAMYLRIIPLLIPNYFDILAKIYSVNNNWIFKLF